MKTSELTGAALDWAVAKCEKNWAFEPDGCDSYSTDWALAGPIIERERICADFLINRQWLAVSRITEKQGYGPTPLIAAMRCYVAACLGDEVDVPEELK